MRKLYIYCGTVSFLIILCIAFLAVQPGRAALNASLPGAVAPDENSRNASFSGEPSETYQCPEKLKKANENNPDVYAWLSIPGTNVDYPVLQSPTSDNYYLKRNCYGEYSVAGAIMTEHSYNSTTFDDPVTIIYGQCMKSGSMFGKLQEYYASAEGLEQYKTIEIYLPDQKREYEVFAAVPYDNRHILYHYDFSRTRIFKAFFNSIESIRSFNAHVRSEARPESDDKVLILSTQMRGDGQQRYLVVARLKTEQP